MNEARLIADLKVNGHHDEAYSRHDTEQQIKNRANRLRKAAGRYGIKVTVKRMQDEEGKFLRVAKV